MFSFLITKYGIFQLLQFPDRKCLKFCIWLMLLNNSAVLSREILMQQNFHAMNSYTNTYCHLYVNTATKILAPFCNLYLTVREYLAIILKLGSLDLLYLYSFDGTILQWKKSTSLCFRFLDLSSSIIKFSNSSNSSFLKIWNRKTRHSKTFFSKSKL